MRPRTLDGFAREVGKRRDAGGEVGEMVSEPRARTLLGRLELANASLRCGARMPAFQNLRYRRNDKAVFLVAFDLLILDGRDLRREPLEYRKAALARLLRNAKSGLQLSEHIEDHPGPIVFKHACRLGLEGIVSKRRELALSVRPLAILDQEQESGGTSSEARS